jgi:eukaryotic-like serine/threonine-protein kinase
MTQYWNDLEGVSLAGRYWLKQCLTASEDEAWYVIRLDTERDAAVRVLRADAPFAHQQLEAWREAIALEHPHIVRLFDAGAAEVEGVALVYAVCEYPDDFLASALAERPLTTAEAGDVLRACVSALAYLHAKELVHGAVDPRHIMAVGDRIKLPCDAIRPSGASAPPAEITPADPPELLAGGPATPASDMWSLGITLIEVLTRTRPVLAPDSEVPFLPEPFGSIARNTLRHDPFARWTVEDVEKHMQPPAAAPAPVPEPEPEVEPVAAMIAEEPVRPVLPPPHPHPRLEAPPRRGLPIKWVPVAGIVAAAALSIVFLRHPEQAPAGPAVMPTHAAPPPTAAPPVVTAPPPKPLEAQPRSNPSAIWRVVAYEYHKREQAEKKAHSLNQKRPALHAEVFAPRGNRAPYFVALGGRLTLAQAEQLKREARALGLPRDTFVRNFSN